MELALVQLAAEPEVAVGRRQQVVAQPSDERLDRGRCAPPPPPSPARAATRRRRPPSRRRPAQVRDARHRLDRLLGVEPRDGAASPGGQVGPGRIEHRGDPLHPGSGAGEPLLHRGELPGEEARTGRRPGDTCRRSGSTTARRGPPRRTAARRSWPAALAGRSPPRRSAARGPRSDARVSASQASRTSRPASVRSGHRWSCS